jgi:hypothetical protein
MLRFHISHIEPDVQFSHIRLSDKASCVRPREVAWLHLELNEPQGVVGVADLIKRCTASMASSALWLARYAYCSGCKSASKIGSSTISVAVSTTRSRIVGMPSGLGLPSGLGMYTQRTACGW